MRTVTFSFKDARGNIHNGDSVQVTTAKTAEDEINVVLDRFNAVELQRNNPSGCRELVSIDDISVDDEVSLKQQMKNLKKIVTERVYFDSQHDLCKVNLVSNAKDGSDAYRCKNCCIEGKRRGFVDYIIVKASLGKILNCKEF